MNTMIAEQPLPTTYKPFDQLLFCSNRLANVQVPLEVEGRPEVLIGSGDLPRVWLSAPTDPGGQTRQFVVEDGISRHSLIRILAIPETESVTVTVGNQEVLRAKKLSDQTAEVDFLDLRPLGLLVYGSAEGLHLGEQYVVGSQFSNMTTAIVLS